MVRWPQPDKGSKVNFVNVFVKNFAKRSGCFCEKFYWSIKVEESYIEEVS